MLQGSLIAIMSVLSGIMYHLGGLGADGAKAYPKWPAWLFSRQIRIIGCPTMVILSSCLLGPLNAWLAVSWVLMMGATSTYWNFLHKQIDKTWWNWALHGLMIGMSMMPYALSSETLLGVNLYSVALGVTMCVWSEEQDSAFYEEFGRGFLMVALIFLLFVR